MAKISNYLNVITGLVEIILVFGFSCSFYFVGTVMVENGHFCDPNLLTDYQVDNQTFEFIKICPEFYKENQLNQMSLIVMLGININALLGYHQGFIVDRFGVLFMRLLTHFCHLTGFLSLAFITFTTEYLTYLAILSFSFGNGVLITAAVRDLPEALPKHKPEVRSITNSIFIASGFIMMLLSKYLLGNPIRFQQFDYFWNLKNFGMVGLAICLCLGVIRTAIWNREIGKPVVERESVIRSPQILPITMNGRNLSSIRRNFSLQVQSRVQQRRGSALPTLARDLRRGSKLLINYQPANEKNSLLSEIKTLKLWRHTLQLNFSNLP